LSTEQQEQLKESTVFSSVTQQLRENINRKLDIFIRIGENLVELKKQINNLQQLEADSYSVLSKAPKKPTH